MKAFYARLLSASRNFSCARAANVAITFALASIPIVTSVGFAVDYSRANSVKAVMQAALDSTALMLSKEASTVSSAQLQTDALSYFKALFTKPEATNISITVSYTTTGGPQVVVNGTANVPTTFLGMIGYNNIPVSGSATTKWGSSRLRVALVLDNTGSMADDGKMPALKSATKDLLTQLQTVASTNGDVYVSIITVAKDVNVGASNYSATWIDWTDWNANNGQWCKSNGQCSSKQNGNAVWTPDNHNTWNGCVTDRGGPNSPDSNNYDQKVVAPGTSAASKFPAEQYDSCPVAMMGLNYNWTAMNNLVDSMQPNGATDQPIGLVWGWQSLVGGGPLTSPAKDPNYQYTDVIVLMSDGLNTQDRWYGNGYNVSSSVDKRMLDTSNNGAGTCANIKNSGVTLYTVQVNTGGDPLSTLLQSCAGSPAQFNDPSKFYMVTTSSGIGTVFNQIATKLTQLRVAK